jgi:hypothetical protein
MHIVADVDEIVVLGAMIAVVVTPDLGSEDVS